MVRRPRHLTTRDLVRRCDVAAVGFAVSVAESTAIRVAIARQRNGEWSVVDDSGLHGLPEAARQSAISISAAVICGANLFGLLVTELEIDDEVRWVRVSRPRTPRTSPAKRRT